MMAPFDTTRLIPEGWSEHHQASVETSFNARIRVVDPDLTTPGAYDPVTKGYGPSTLSYSLGGPDDANPEWRTGAPCRIDHVLEERSAELGAEQVGVRGYLVQLPAGATGRLHRGHEAEVVECRNDAAFVGEKLVLQSYLHGSERFNTDTYWTHTQAS